ncbi:MAG: methyltransferase domain-containing protein [Nitrospirae bacterium]|nr:MAG: methyltransferase domain-containing protein [Nitrospirota bacterium]
MGAGIGNYTGHIKVKADRMYAIDIDPIGCTILKHTHPDVDVRMADAGRLKEMRQFIGLGIDTIVCLNVLEHIIDDIGTLENFNRILSPGGRAIILVPAIPKLYGPIDEMLMHKRRYTRTELTEKIKFAGFEIEESHYMNAPAVFGWYLNKVFKKTKQSPLQVKIYDFFIPLIREIEDLIKPKIGLSVFAVGKKS